MLSDKEKKAIESFKEENNNDLSKFDDFNSYTQFKVKRDKLIIDLIEKQSKEIEELKEDSCCMTKCLRRDKEKLFLEDKINQKIEELEKEQEDNRKNLYNAVNNLCFKEIDKISDKIYVNMSVRDILQSLLEKE